MSLTDELKKSVTDGKTATGRLQIIACLDDVKEALENGFNRTTIWQHLSDSGRVTISYKRFTQLLNQLLPTDTPAKARQETAMPSPVKKAEGEPTNATPSTTEIDDDDDRFAEALRKKPKKTFVHNPIASKDILK